MPLPKLDEIKTYCRVTGSQDDALLSSMSEVAQRQFKKILAIDQNDALPDNPSMSLAIKEQVQVYYENRAFFKPEMEKAMSQRILNLIGDLRDVSKFIPSVENNQ